MLFGGACAHFGTGSFGAGVALTDPVGRLADAANHHPDVDPAGRGPSFWFQQMDAPRPQRNRSHIDISVPHDQAETRIAAVIAAGGHLVTDQHAPSWWVLADAKGNECCVATWMGRD